MSTPEQKTCQDFKKLKQKHEEEEEDVLQNSDKTFQTNLLSLSDDVLLLILSYLNPVDLMSLSQCCLRLFNVCSDKTLWEIVDMRPHVLPVRVLKKYTSFLQPSTKFLALYGPVKSNEFNPNLNYTPLNRNFFRAVSKRATNLKTLILDNHIIDNSNLMIEDLPPTLEHLAIRNCEMWNQIKDRSYFYRLELCLPNLKHLDLSNNNWFDPHSLLALSKSLTLEHLVLTRCNVSECLPYASLATNFGFNTLTCLDLRNTLVSDIEITCFNRTATLRELYLSAPEIDIPDALVTDSGITKFGMIPRRQNGDGVIDVANGVVIIEVGSYHRRPPSKLEVLVIQNYHGVTDRSLVHVASAMQNLLFLDISRTGCSETGVRHFKNIRSEVTVVSESLYDFS